MNNKRGQAALEFLTTYGWAFLVILLVIGGLAYFDVFNITSRLPDGCSIEGNSFTCGDIFQVNSNSETVTLQITNNLQRAANIDTMLVIERTLNDGDFTGACSDNNAGAGFPVNPGNRIEQQFDFTAQSCGIVEYGGEKRIYDFWFNYTQQGSNIVNIARGSVTTTVI